MTDTTVPPNKRVRRSVAAVNAAVDSDSDNESPMRHETRTQSIYTPLLASSLTHKDIDLSLQVTNKEALLWERLDAAARSQLTKATVRLFLFRGSKQERITREHIKTALVAHDPAYKKHISSAVHAAQKQLQKTFGYNIVLAAQHATDTKSPALASIVASRLPQVGYEGLLMVVATAIWCAPSGKIEMHNLYNHLRNVDASFLDAGAPRGRHTSSTSLDNDLGAHLSRLEKEGYIRIIKDAHDAKDVMKSSVQLGVRFHVEIGIDQLARAYYATIGEPIHENIIANLKRGEFVIYQQENPDDAAAPAPPAAAAPQAVAPNQSPVVERAPKRQSTRTKK